MELLSPLSLLLATVQLHFVFSSDVCPNAGDLEIGNLTWKLECCMSNRKQFTLKIVAQKIDSLDSMYSSEMCPGTNYRERKCLNFSLAVENGIIKVSVNDTVCKENYTQPECHPNVTFNNTAVNLPQQNGNICFNMKSKNGMKVKIKFQCAEYPAANISLHSESKSWIDALEDCQMEHFSLVEICEKKVRDDVKRLQNKTDSKTGVWIGLQRSIFGYSPEWKWISGYNVVKSQLNRTSSANSDFDNHCGKVIFDNKTEEIKWSNANCHEKLPYICQRMNEKPCTDDYTEKSELFIDID
ncbi:unnamed protein product [Oreochromis niloticus]|nr:unnamed protein product [Mustela putorius furo]